MTAVPGRWRRILVNDDLPPVGAHVRVLHRDGGRPWLAMVGTFLGGGTVRGGVHDGAFVIDVEPDPAAPGLDDQARAEARQWHEMKAAGWPDGPRFWRVDDSTILQVRDEIPARDETPGGPQ